MNQTFSHVATEIMIQHTRIARVGAQQWSASSLPVTCFSSVVGLWHENCALWQRWSMASLAHTPSKKLYAILDRPTNSSRLHA